MESNLTNTDINPTVKQEPSDIMKYKFAWLSNLKIK
jgi:hypothetical protein